MHTNVRHRTVVFDLPADGIAVVALIAMEDARPRHLLEQGCPGGAISDLTAGQREGDRLALAIGQRVDLGRALTAEAPMA